jgi:hypothetical protein
MSRLNISPQEPDLPAKQAEYRTGSSLFRCATAADDNELRAMLRANDMDSWVNLAFEREPSFFTGENLMGTSTAVIALDEAAQQTPIGMYTCSLLPVHINGQAAFAGYLGGLRVNQQYRRRIRILKDGFASIPRLISYQRTMSCWFTSVGHENSKARRILETGLKNMPSYQLVGSMETLAFSTRLGKHKGLLQQATIHDVPALSSFFNRQASAFQFSPLLSEAWLLSLNGQHGLELEDFWLLRDGNELSGCLAIWDQRKFKQTVVRSYRFPLNKLRGAYNLLAGMRGKIRLPVPGEKLEQVFISFFALSKRAQSMAVDVISEALLHASKKNAAIGTLGLSDRNPLTSVLQAALHPDSYRTRLETVIWPDANQPELDNRPAQPEVAVL